MNTPKYAEYIKTRKPPNPVFLEVWKKLQAEGSLDNLSDDDALEKVVSTTEMWMESK